MQILEKLKPVSILLLRLGIAVVFLGTGYDKLFRSPAKWLVWFPHQGYPSYFAYIAGTIEFFGAILLVVGLFTRGVALLFALQMGIAEATVTAWHANIYAATSYAVPLLLCLSCFAIATMGPGMLSLDEVLEARFSANKRKYAPEVP